MKSTATSGVREPRNAALAAVVVSTAYTKAMEARNRPRLALTIHRPLRHARIVGNACRLKADKISITTMMPTERQIRYWNASTSSDRRFRTAPKLQTMPDPIAISDATTGRR